MTRSPVSLAFGRILRLGMRPEQPGDVAQYEACRAIILDELAPLRIDVGGVAVAVGIVLEPSTPAPLPGRDHVLAHQWHSTGRWHITRVTYTEAEAHEAVRALRRSDRSCGWHVLRRAILRWPAGERIPFRALGAAQFRALSERLVYGPAQLADPEP